MKIILIGANGTIGQGVYKALQASGHAVISVGKTRGDYQVDIAEPASITALYKKIGTFDAVVSAAGDIDFAPLADLTHDQWLHSLGHKLLGQINLVQQALPYINDNGSFTLVGGILAEVPIKGGAIASTVNRALEGYVMAAACELTRGLRINLVSPTMLTESAGVYGDFFPGFIPVDGKVVAEAFKKSVMGIQTGQVFKLH